MELTKGQKGNLPDSAIVGASEERLGIGGRLRRPAENVNRVRMGMEQMNAVLADGRIVDGPKADAAPLVTGGDYGRVDRRVNRQTENTVFGYLRGVTGKF